MEVMQRMSPLTQVFLPVESVLSSLNLSKVPFDQIVRAVLVEIKSSKVSQKNTFQSILKRVVQMQSYK